MHGARKLVIDGLKEKMPLASPGKLSILDLCSGDGEIAEWLEVFGNVVSVDFDPRRSKSTRHPKLLRDVAYTPWYWAKRNSFDVVVCAYSLQHVWGDEPAVWREIRRVLKPGGFFFNVGRHDLRTPHWEPRADPGRTDTPDTLVALGISSGLHPQEILLMKYDEVCYRRVELPVEANAFFGVFRKGKSAASWSEAKCRYDLLSVDGWMHEDELQWLYETAAGQAGGTVVEIGTFLGKGACSILAGLQEGGGGRLVCVDTFDGRGTSRHEEMKKLGVEGVISLHRAATRKRGLPDPFFYVGRSHDEKIAGVFEKEGVDWLFVDGSHDADSVDLDLKTWVPKVARGGIISGHDYHTDFPGVISAVNDRFSRVFLPAGSIWKVEA